MHADVAVIGAGIVGLSVAYEIARRGLQVVCMDPAPASRQSAGRGRIFRLTHDSAEAVTLANMARVAWSRWEAELGAHLIRSTGCAVIGEDARVHANAMRDANAEFTWSDSGRLPQLKGILDLDGDLKGPALFDPSGGTIDAEQTINLLYQRVSPEPERIVRIIPQRGVVRLESMSGRTWKVDQTVVATGVDSMHLLAKLGLPMAQETYRHVRFTLRPSGPLASLDCCFLDRRRAIPSGWSFYVLRLDEGVVAVGGGWSEAPFEVRRWEPALVRKRSELQVKAWLTLHGEDSATIVGILECDYSLVFVRLPEGAPYKIIHADRILTIHGGNLFKFAPLIGNDVCNVLNI